METEKIKDYSNDNIDKFKMINSEGKIQTLVSIMFNPAGQEGINEESYKMVIMTQNPLNKKRHYDRFYFVDDGTGKGKFINHGYVINTEIALVRELYSKIISSENPTIKTFIMALVDEFWILRGFKFVPLYFGAEHEKAVIEYADLITVLGQ